MAPLSPMIGETISHYRVAENLGGGSERRTQDHHDPVETQEPATVSVGRDPSTAGHSASRRMTVIRRSSKTRGAGVERALAPFVSLGAPGFPFSRDPGTRDDNVVRQV